MAWDLVSGWRAESGLSGTASGLFRVLTASDTVRFLGAGAFTRGRTASVLARGRLVPGSGPTPGSRSLSRS